jgi:hypothetical protein
VAAGRLINYKLGIALMLLLNMFLLVGGFSVAKTYMIGASSYEEYIFGATAPFFFGFVLVGFFGLLNVYRWRGSSKCLYAFMVVLLSYVCIEILFTSCGAKL